MIIPPADDDERDNDKLSNDEINQPYRPSHDWSGHLLNVAFPLSHFWSCSGLVTFLCTPSASYTTGQCISIDGGFSVCGLWSFEDVLPHWEMSPLSSCAEHLATFVTRCGGVLRLSIVKIQSEQGCCQAWYSSMYVLRRAWTGYVNESYNFYRWIANLLCALQLCTLLW